jgi:hypothetical protein
VNVNVIYTSLPLSLSTIQQVYPSISISQWAQRGQIPCSESQWEQTSLSSWPQWVTTRRQHYGWWLLPFRAEGLVWNGILTSQGH